MRTTSYAIAIAAVFAATAASAQTVNLTGAYRCIEGCRTAPVGSPAFVTQNGPNSNLLNEAGQPSRPGRTCCADDPYLGQFLEHGRRLFA